MRSRPLAGALTAALVAGGLALAGSAAADPTDGEGCAGVPSIPAAYVCVIEVTPGGVVPSTSTTSFPVDLPRVCYVAGCTDPAPVNVPVPGASAGNGHVAVLYYNGQYTPVAVGTGELVNIGGTVLDLAGSAVGIALAEADDAIDVVQGLPTPDELEQAVVDLVVDKLAPYLAKVEALQGTLSELTLDDVIEIVLRVVDRYVPPLPFCIC
jgi:hypothetical protein